MNVNVVIIGHVDHGKSTLIGRLLYDSDSITEGRVEEIQRLAEEYKRRFEFAYFLDSFDDELKEERTIDTTGVMFKGKNLYSVTDVPGHKEFIKNMLTGASHADVAVLVVSAEEGIQEQTGRHAFLVHMLGIKQLFVMVNKMDILDYKEAAFQDIKNKVSRLLTSFGYHDVAFIPGSAMEGDNIYKRSERMQWYHGPTLIEALDRVELKRGMKPLRFVVQDIYQVDSDKIIVGRVESGTIRRGDEVVFYPSGVRGKVNKIKVFGNELEMAESGDSIGITADCEPKRGDVCGLTENPPISTNEFKGEAVLLGDNLKEGDMVELRCSTQRIKCKIKEILEKIDSETGAVLAQRPSHISQHEAATILFATEPVVVEKFSDIPELGRFVLVRDKNIGAGVVLETAA
ncbi:MAG: 50S ribosome-binding GTPase [Dehalococcoidia bacterium]|nr:50S ribosome-binding GTPase [Dehalococcoidia bacterium]